MVSEDWLGFLLELLEAPKLVFTRSTLNYQAAVGKRLLDSRILVHADYQSVIENERGETVEVYYDNDRGGLGYYDQYRGWMSVEQTALERFKPDLSSLFAILLGEHLRPLPKGPKEVDPDSCWMIGSAKLAGHRSTEVWFARHLWKAATAERIRVAMSQQTSETLRLVLTSTPDHRVGNCLVPARIISVADVVSPYQTDRIDIEILKARYQDHQTPTVDTVVHFSEETGVLSVHGNRIVQVKSERHRDILRLVVETHHKRGIVEREFVLRKANSNARSFDQAFGERHWPAINSVFKYNKTDRVWRFIV